jgi:hypothetical protein
MGRRVLLERQKISVELVKVLVRLDQELGNDLVDRLHRRSPQSGGWDVVCIGFAGTELEPGG